MIKRKIIIAVMFSFLVSAFAYPALAQGQQATDGQVPLTPREERRKEKEERKQLKRERRKQRYLDEYGESGRDKGASTIARPAATNINFKYPPTVIKSRYRVDVLAYMYLDELVQAKAKAKPGKDVIPEKALTGVSVYEGASIAADSLKRAGFNIDIYIHDVTTRAESLDTLINNGLLDSTDLIIGAVQGSDMARVAEYAKQRKINFVSAFSTADGGVKANKYFTMLQPSIKTQCRRITRDIANKYPGMNVSLLYSTATVANEDAYRYVIGGDEIVFKQRLCNTLPSKEELSTLFDISKPNVVIVPIMEAGFADSLMRRLSKDFSSTHFEVYGMHTWSGIKTLRKETGYPNLSVNIPTLNTIDPNSPAAKFVAKQYKEFFGGKPSDRVYYAYETMMWYASLLKQYGTMFNSNYSDNTSAPFTKFEIRQLRDADGHILYNENRFIPLTRYEGGVSRTQ